MQTVDKKKKECEWSEWKTMYIIYTLDFLNYYYIYIQEKCLACRTKIRIKKGCG